MSSLPDLPPPALESLRASTRRRFLRDGGVGLGALALGSLLDPRRLGAATAPAGAGQLPGTHLAPKAKNTIYPL
ncbi:MAG: hypothetical protein ACKO3N_14455, partial [Verrucomicrobiota bacterium]